MPKPTDLRVELLDLGATARRLVESRALLEPAVNLLAKRGYAPDRLARLLEGGDPYLAYHHAAKAEARLTDFAPDFVRLLLPALRRGELGMTEVASWAAQWAAANNDERLRAALTRLAMLAPLEALRLSPLWMGADDVRRSLVVRILTAFDVSAIAMRCNEGQWLAHAEALCQALSGTEDDV
jgi:hypothetical protein